MCNMYFRICSCAYVIWSKTSETEVLYVYIDNW